MTARQPSHLPYSKLCTAWPGPGPDSILTSFYPQARRSASAHPLDPPSPSPSPQSAQGPGRRTLLLALKGKGVPGAQPSCAHGAPACAP